MFKDGKEVLYLYTIKNGKFFIHEGTVESIVGIGKKVRFSDGSSPRRYPTKINVLDTAGPNIWLTDRDDVLAKNKFIEYEEQKLADLKEQIRRKEEIIKLLKERV